MRPYLSTLDRFCYSLHSLSSLKTLLPRPAATLVRFCVSRTANMAAATPQQPPAPAVQVRKEIDVSETERKIFDRLLATLRHFELQTELRVAGGWVRDKLLGRDCYDIDIAIDNMLGSAFVDKVIEYLSSTGEKAQGVAVIPCNPDQSKHLETARMRLFDLWIDFVNLRSEDYCENSRIPTMEFGTAKEDAYRRDLTINSLFYNINSGVIEDFTERGIEDLQSGRIVTPLPPKSTFLDDPLRVLRAIRFGARFGFALDEELKEAAASEEVKNALSAKISKERVGTEIDLMISGNQPVKAVMHIADLTLFSIVFSSPHEVEPPLSEGFQRSCVAYLDAAWNLGHSIGSSSFTDDERRLYLYAALFLPFRSATYKDGKGKKIPVVNYILKDSLKRKSSDSEMIVKIHASMEKFLKLIPLLTSDKDAQPTEIFHETEFLDVPSESKLRVATGNLLREIKEFWRVALLMSILVYKDTANPEQESQDSQLQLDRRTDLFKSVESAVRLQGLENVWNVKPLVNGEEIMEVLQLKSGGPLVREWQQKLMAWQLAHPTRTTEECIDWMKEMNSKRTRVE